jgi:hypothetical protein
VSSRSASENGIEAAKPNPVTALLHSADYGVCNTNVEKKRIDCRVGISTMKNDRDSKEAGVEALPSGD